MMAIGLISLAFAVKTFTRNQVWVNDFTLFTTDVKTSKNSAKVLNAAGGALQTEVPKEKDVNKKKSDVAAGGNLPQRGHQNPPNL